MIEIVILADDLTGAMDTGVQFTKYGISTIVTTKLDTEVLTTTDARALVINTESRHLKEKIAKQKIMDILKILKTFPIKYYYKKVDSTLRGNIRGELEGFMEELKIFSLPFIPAFPKSKRTIKKGILYVNKVEINQTEFANDILNPISESYIPDIIKSNIPISLFENENFSSLKEGICLFDSSEDKELEKIGNILYQNNQLFYTAGSAGFAEIIAKKLGTSSPSTFKKNIKNENILFICGSINPISIEQCEYASQNFKTLNLNIDDLLNQDLKNYIAQLKNYKNILVRTVKDKKDILISEKYFNDKNIPLKEGALNISKELGKLTKHILDITDTDILIVFGGDTLISILNALNCSLIFPITEITPGVVLGKIKLSDKEIFLITKAGGFGSIKIWDEIKTYLY